ncbi:4'-phosphopantetheinyl transferase superfamily protein [Candidatus Mycoplasma pogonae]
MIGVDIAYIPRFKNKSLKFVQRILSPLEYEEFLTKDIAEKSLFLAKSWSIKEALFKADNSLLEFNKITLIKKANNYYFPGFKISTSKENNYVIAFVIKEGAI